MLCNDSFSNMAIYKFLVVKGCFLCFSVELCIVFEDPSPLYSPPPVHFFNRSLGAFLRKARDSLRLHPCK